MRLEWGSWSKVPPFAIQMEIKHLWIDCLVLWGCLRVKCLAERLFPTK